MENKMSEVKMKSEDNEKAFIDVIDGPTSVFARTTAYANSKVKSSTSITIIPKKKKATPRKARRVTPSKSKLPAYDPKLSIKKFLIRSKANKDTTCVVPYKISSRSDSWTSKFNNYPMNADDPMPGDLVMATAGDIGMSSFKNGELRRNELIFGRAKCFTYRNTSIDGIDGEDPYLVKDLELLKVEWSIRPGRRMNHPVDMTRLWVKVIAKANDPNMVFVSDFVKEEAYKHYYFGLPEGWMGMDVAVKDECAL